MIVDAAVYENGLRQPGELALDEVPAACHRENAFVWLGLHEPTEEEFDAVRREFELHELAVEDAICAHQRPKLEIYGESVFVVLKTARYVDHEEAVEIGEIMMFVGPSFIVVVRHGEASPLGDVRRRIEHRPDLLRHGPVAVAYAITDKVVDDYAPVIAGIDNDIQEVEYEVFSASDTNAAERIYKLKREVLELGSAMAPLVEPMDKLVNQHYRFVPEELVEYYRDVNDHLLREVSQVQNYRDLLTSILEANLTRVSVRQNEDMRKISAWIAIAAVPTMIAGLYGMNFENMPELGWDFGYFVVLGVIAGVCLFMYRAFRKSGWL
ncbi:MAG: magnesium/cobalt transporter CorA [Actinobacteria bacterium]|nr:magnesium/cobalt transporter CorA [Actinomycetota bacterium]